MRFFEGYHCRKRCYGVQQLSMGYCAVFNHRKYLLKVVMDTISIGVNLCRRYYGNLNMYKGNKKIMSFAAFMYCLYHDLDTDNIVFENNVCHRVRKDNYIENCRAENLYLGGTSVLTDETDDCILAISNKDTFKDFFSPMPIITEILNKCVALQWGTGNRLYCRTKNDGGFFAADLAYLAYYDIDLTVDNYIEKIKALKAYKKINGLSIEHLDSDFHNHRKYNIALVKGSLNSVKNDKISRIVEPYCFTVVYDNPFYIGVESDDIFKIITGVFNDDLMIKVEKNFMTDNFENVVNLLNIYIAEYLEKVDKEEALLNNKRLIFDVRFAEMLSKESKEHFTCLNNLSQSSFSSYDE